MNSGRDIPADVLRRLTPAQAWEYMLVPYADEGGRLKCYGEQGRRYDDALAELEVLYGTSAEVTALAPDEFGRMLRECYRWSAASPASAAASVASAAGDRGFLLGIIEEAFDVYASDVHVECYEQRCRIRFRIDGKLLERYAVGMEDYAPLVNQIKIMASMDISEKRLPQDGRILYDRGGKKFDVRVSSLPTIYGEKLVLRLLTRHAELLELENLGLTVRQLEDYRRAVERPYGMVLICGPTGSGKSTTLYATLRRLNRAADNILTIEDPVEYTLEGVNQVQLKEEIGLTFSRALRTFLRQDPDIIMLGEIRDPDTARIAVRSSLTGHLLFSTIHTNTAWGSVARLTDMGIHPYLIADTLILCAAQRLVRLLCPRCKRPRKAAADVAELSGTDARLYEAVGCPQCYYTGYSGRKAVYEVIPMDEGLARAVREGEADPEPLLRERGIVSIREAAVSMLAAGETSYEELISILTS